VTFYGHYVKMCEDFVLNFGDKRTGCYITTTHCLTLPFSPGNFFFTKNDMTVVPTHPTLLFPRLEIKLKRCHVDTVEVIEIESQAVLNTLTEHDFQDAFINGRNAGTGADSRKGTSSRVTVASMPKVSF
jgi:hypothetical protein